MSGIIVTENNAQIIAEWCSGKHIIEHDPFDYDVTFPAINVPTKNGVERASLGDLVARTEDGFFKIIKQKDIHHGPDH